MSVAGDDDNYIAGSPRSTTVRRPSRPTQIWCRSGASFVNAGSLKLNDDAHLPRLRDAAHETESGTTPAVPGGLFTNTGAITSTPLRVTPP